MWGQAPFFANLFSFRLVYVVQYYSMELYEEIVANREIGARRLVAEYGDRLFGASLVLCHDRQAAEDLVFRTFEQVVEKISLYDPKQSFYNWCYTILLNYFRSDCRKMKAVVADEESWVEEHAQAARPDAPDHGERIGAEDLRTAVDSLPPKLRETVVLHYYDDKSIEEMSRITSSPIGTVKWRLNKARMLLKRALNAHLSITKSRGGG